jgi:hypothetical protein
MEQPGKPTTLTLCGDCSRTWCVLRGFRSNAIPSLGPATCHSFQSLAVIGSRRYVGSHVVPALPHAIDVCWFSEPLLLRVRLSYNLQTVKDLSTLHIYYILYAVDVWTWLLKGALVIKKKR